MSFNPYPRNLKGAYQYHNNLFYLLTPKQIGLSNPYTNGAIARGLCHTHTHTHKHTHTHTSTHTRITYIHMYIYTYVCIHIHPSIHTYIHTYIQTYIHTYIHIHIGAAKRVLQRLVLTGTSVTNQGLALLVNFMCS